MRNRCLATGSLGGGEASSVSDDEVKAGEPGYYGLSVLLPPMGGGGRSRLPLVEGERTCGVPCPTRGQQGTAVRLGRAALGATPPKKTRDAANDAGGYTATGPELHVASVIAGVVSLIVAVVPECLL